MVKVRSLGSVRIILTLMRVLHTYTYHTSIYADMPSENCWNFEIPYQILHTSTDQEPKKSITCTQVKVQEISTP